MKNFKYIMIKLNEYEGKISVKRILFAVILILNSFLFGCNENLDISSNNKEEIDCLKENDNLSEYREEIELLYVELKSKYEYIKETNETNEWIEFKNLFDNKLSYIKEKVLDTKLKYSVDNLENLYNEYDREINKS